MYFGSSWVTVWQCWLDTQPKTTEVVEAAVRNKGSESKEEDVDEGKEAENM